MNTHLASFVGLFLTAIASVAAPPALSEVKTLKLHLKEGNCFTLREGEVTEKFIDRNFSTNGETKLVITKNDKAEIVGNVGSSTVVLSRHPNSLTFLETTMTGSVHTLTVFDQWVEKEGGFACIYHRNVSFGKLTGNGLMVSTFYGVARPSD